MCDECQEMDMLQEIVLFTTKEIRLLRDKRKSITLKNLRSCKFDGFLVALKFDLNLIDDINYRRSQTLTDDYKFEVDFIILKRIVDLHCRIIEMEPHDQRVLLTDQYEYYSTKVSKCIDRLIALNSKCPDIWILASKWHFNLRSYEKAKKYMCQGVVENHTSLILFKEFFTLELSIATKKHSGFDNARKIFNCIKEHVPLDSNVTYICSLIDIADNYDNSGQIQNEMILALKEKYSRSAYFLNYLAQRELMGKRYGANENEIDDNTAWKNAWDFFKVAIEKVPTVEMWKYYIKTALATSEATPAERYIILKSGYDYMLSSQVKVLNDRHLINLAKLETDKNTKDTILKLATEKYPQSVLVWCEYLQFAMQLKDDLKFRNIFRQGVDYLQSKSLPLWQLRLDYVSSRGWKNLETFVAEMRGIYLEGIGTQPDEVSQKLIVSYFDWLVTQVGMPPTRKAYYSVTDHIKSMACHSKMLELELIRPTPVDDVVAIVLELACKQFGHTDITPWFHKIDYIKNKDPSKVQAVYERAMANLEPPYAKIFDIQFQLYNLREH